ncbi:NADPH2:quinone reductase [Fusarium beomiforme]|uniref:NADPH2:quinone reductase n=1 Tax=Fusarium beomiforme TaxID=44412 RepID=A0A9P5AGK5_9HYPO|nr:NADPH2:quinone reductase [Fusarium beomiforme]
MADQEPTQSPDSVPLTDLPRDVESCATLQEPTTGTKSFKALAKNHFVSLFGWILALVGTAVSIAALLPAFRGLLLSDRQLRLAEWSALKDYLDQCKEDSVRE